MTSWGERERWAIYAAIIAALATGHARRRDVARALEHVLLRGRPADDGS